MKKYNVKSEIIRLIVALMGVAFYIFMHIWFLQTYDYHYDILLLYLIFIGKFILWGLGTAAFGIPTVGFWILQKADAYDEDGKVTYYGTIVEWHKEYYDGQEYNIRKEREGWKTDGPNWWGKLIAIFIFTSLISMPILFVVYLFRFPYVMVKAHKQ